MTGLCVCTSLLKGQHCHLHLKTFLCNTRVVTGCLRYRTTGNATMCFSCSLSTVASVRLQALTWRKVSEFLTTFSSHALVAHQTFFTGRTVLLRCEGNVQGVAFTELLRDGVKTKYLAQNIVLGSEYRAYVSEKENIE